MDTNSEKPKIEKIGELDFLDVKVPIFYDPFIEGGLMISWGIRNPKSEYVGIVYYDPYTKKYSYPEDAVIPEQTERDREKLPKFIIIGKRELITNDEKDYLEIIRSAIVAEYKWVNPKLWRGYQIDRIFSI